MYSKEGRLPVDREARQPQLALAWLLHQGRDVVPIPGTKRCMFLQENARAADVALSTAALRRIAEVAPKGAAAGERYAEGGLRAVNG